MTAMNNKKGMATSCDLNLFTVTCVKQNRSCFAVASPCTFSNTSSPLAIKHQVPCIIRHVGRFIQLPYHLKEKPQLLIPEKNWEEFFSHTSINKTRGQDSEALFSIKPNKPSSADYHNMINIVNTTIVVIIIKIILINITYHNQDHHKYKNHHNHIRQNQNHDNHYNHIHQIIINIVIVIMTIVDCSMVRHSCV